jgi:hypothetical protein
VNRLGPRSVSLVRAMARTARVGVLLPLGLAARVYGGTDKLVHGYTRPYATHLSGRRWTVGRVLEIGVGGYESATPGGSLRLWRDHFPRSVVVGLDLHHKHVRLGRRVRFVQGDQRSGDAIDATIAALGGPPEVVIDDGSHFGDHAEVSFSYLFPLMPAGSLYVIEDLHTSYWDSFGGSIPAGRGTAIGFVRALVDAVQAGDETFDRKPHWGPRPPIEVGDVAAIHVYPGVAFIEKVRTRPTGSW